MSEDKDSSSEIAKRANQEDPIVMYLIVRESLGMSIGKTAAQVGHAVGMLDRKYIELLNSVNNPDCKWGVSNKWDDGCWKDIQNLFQIWREWNDSSFRKVVLKASDKEWGKLKEFKTLLVPKVIIIDNGLTEIPAQSETVIGVWPMRKSQRPKILAKLQALK